MIDGRTLEHKTLAHLRSQAVRRVLEDGERPSVVMPKPGLVSHQHLSVAAGV